MFPRHHRLTRPADFKRTIRAGAKASSRCVVVYGLMPGSPQPESGPRVGVTVSKAVGGAVVRHRVARQIRHAASALLEHLPAGSSWVIRALPPAAVSTDVAADVRACVERILGGVR